MPKLFTSPIALMRWIAGTLAGLGAAAQLCVAAPVVQQVSGTFAHKASVTVSGAGFGTKDNGATFIFDDASGSSIEATWDYVCNAGAAVDWRVAYRSPGQIKKANGVVGGVPLPHAHATRYIAGAHYNPTGVDANRGTNVCAGMNNTQGRPYTYISYYLRVDPDFVYKCAQWATGECDRNFKEYARSVNDGYFGGNRQVYGGAYFSDKDRTSSQFLFNYGEFNEPLPGERYTQPLNVRTVNESVMVWYNGSEPEEPNTGLMFPRGAFAPTAIGQWVKIEYEFLHNDAQRGVHRAWINGKLSWEAFVDDDDNPNTTPRSETPFGGYSRDSGSEEKYKNNWRYYADVYYDRSWARVMLANHADLAKATVLEPQPIASWNNGQVSFNVNLGRLPAGTAYLFVVDANGVRNTSGYPVTLGGGPPPARPNPPGNFRTQ